MDGSNAAARENTLSLMCEMTRWIGKMSHTHIPTYMDTPLSYIFTCTGKTPLMSLVDNMRPAQKADFEKFMSELNRYPLSPTYSSLLSLSLSLMLIIVW